MPAQRTLAASAPNLTITMIEAEPVPLVVPGDQGDQSLFILVDLRYSGNGVLYLNTRNFRIVDQTGGSGAGYSPQSYSGALPSSSGPQPLPSEDLVAPAHARGWLLFTVPKGVQNVYLGYEVWLKNADNPILVKTRPFTPRLSPLWRYALAAKPALQTYLADEAQAAGYVRMALDPRFTGGQAIDASALNRLSLADALATLRRDHAAFDRIAALGRDAQSLKKRSDATFTAVENDLSAALKARVRPDWTALQATLSGDDRALADLYQTWPGVVARAW